MPVLLSVGYAACHWCHVMAHESFEDEATAAYMNEHYVNIKVDREERPDVDAVYMQATVAMTGQGGWPMTCVLDHEGSPFFAGTYFPDQPRHGQPSFRQLLEAIDDAWTNRSDEVAEASSRGSGRRSARTVELSGGVAFDRAALDAAVARCGRDFDADGVGSAARRSSRRRWCWSSCSGYRRARPRQATRRQMAGRTLAAMAAGGIHDQLAGGFARYGVDRAWVVPHFEKMLYDNGQLLSVYARWAARNDDEAGGPGRPRIADFLLAELGTAEGAFASALDADSEGEEGTFYVWTPAQLVEVLGPDDGAWAAELLTVTERGTFENGTSTLQLREPARRPGRAGSRCATRLLAARASGCGPPATTRWWPPGTGWRSAGWSRRARCSAIPSYVDAAVRCGEFLAERAPRGRAAAARLPRRASPGPTPACSRTTAASPPGSSRSPAPPATACGWSAPGAARHGARALRGRGRRLPRHRRRRRGADGAAADPSDNASPSGHSAVVHALLSYAALTGSGRHRDAAERALLVSRRLADSSPRFAGWSLAAAETALDGPVEVAVVGPAWPERDALEPPPGGTPRSARSSWPPNPGQSTIPLMADRDLVDGRPAAYVCRNLVCQRPVTSVEDLAVLQAG